MRLFGLNITRDPRLAASKRSGDGSAPETPVSQLTPAAAAWLRGEDPGPRGPSLTNAYQQSVWVYRAINVLAEQIANIPFLFSRGERGRENLVTSGPLLEFYSHPHPQINRFQYWELRIIWLMLRGECMRVPIFDDSPSLSSSGPPLQSSWRGARGEDSRSPNGCSSSLSSSGGEGRGEEASTLSRSHAPRSSRSLRSVLILDPSNFQHVVDNNELVGWRYTGFSPGSPIESQVFLPEEVWFEKLPNPFDFWRGMPPLLLADLAAKTDFAASAFMHGLMENNADLGVIVRTDQLLTDEQQDQILAALANRKRRAGVADKPLLLWSGAEVIKPTLSSADLQYLENRKFSRAEICAAFGVPEEIVSITDNTKYDVMAGSRLNFIENRVAPLCARLEAEEEQTVKAIDPTAAGWFDTDSLPLMQQARRTRLQAAKTGFDMGIPFNELNRAMDLGFKPQPWGNTGYLPSKYQPLQSPTPASPNPSGGGSSQSQS